ncbi:MULTISPECIES: VCBS domain-containing protein, partial [Synergistaceae]|uniref:VCBS domain-containing protein n=1 Tax=Synergistaceae TaxID=649777 RepID=UPI003ADA4564|nr:VCBS domain-containing protein [Synergistaceae bacterium DZ-S4]
MENKNFAVIKVSGEAFRQAADNTMIPVRAGDILTEGDIIIIKSGTVELRTASGVPIELAEGSTVLLKNDGGTEEITGAALPSSALGGHTGDTPNEKRPGAAKEEDSEIRESEEGVIRDGHSHVRLERISLDYNDRFNFSRDANELFSFDTRATKIPRVGFNYDYPDSGDNIPRSEIEDPYSGGIWMPESGWVNRPPAVVSDETVTNEDTALILDLLKNASDPDTHLMSVISATALHGTVTINPDGTVTYTPNEDYHGSDTITYKVSDGYGGITESTVTVTVKPVQDAFNDADTTDEDTPVTLNVMDNDTFGPNAILTSVTQGKNGTVTFDKYGNVIYTPGDYFQSLADGETATDTFTYTVTTAGGNKETATVTITITGTNDAPKISVIAGDDDAKTIYETDAALTTNGTLTLYDVDTSNTVTVSVVDSLTKSGTYTGSLPTDAELKAMFTASGGLTSTEQGKDHGISWNFASGTHTFDKLATGETLILTYTVQVDDGKGGTVTQDVTITIVGTNDAPLIGSGAFTGSASEIADKALGENTDDHTVTGSFDVTDLDLSDSVTVSHTEQGGGYIGTFTPVVATQPTGGVTGSIGWEFKVNDSILDSLAEGQTVTQKYDVTVDDGKGGTDTVTVTVTITGTNDAPEIHVKGTDSDAESLTETNAGLSTSGTLSVFDVDTLDTVAATKVSNVTVSNTFGGTMPTEAELLAMFTVSGGDSSTTEQWSDQGIGWTFNSGSEPFDEIPLGESLVITYTVRATDNNGAWTEHNVTITITGTNDLPVAVADVDDVKEEDVLSATGNVLINDSDIDHGDTFTVTGVKEGTHTSATGNVATSVVGTYGSVVIDANGEYTYTLDNTKDEVQALAKDQKVTDTFTYTITDSKGGTATTTLTITVEGTNDAPEIHVKGTDSDAETLTETNAGLSTSGTLSVFDVDTLDTVAATKVSNVTVSNTFGGT